MIYHWFFCCFFRVELYYPLYRPHASTFCPSIHPSIHPSHKIGSLGAYSCLFALLPELDIGITVLAAGDLPAGIANAIAEALTQTYIPHPHRRKQS